MKPSKRKRRIQAIKARLKEYYHLKEMNNYFKRNFIDNADINGSLNILKRGMKFDFDFKDCFFRPEKIDIQKKLLNFA